MNNRQSKISIVIPAHNETSGLRLFLHTVDKVIQNLNEHIWEFVFVDDGSTDSTWEIINDLSRTDRRVKGVRLSRNFGKEVALTAGAESADNADAVIFIDADLQHPPSIIPELVKQWKEGFQIVSAQRKSIQYSMVREFGSTLFYFMLRRYSDLDIQPKASDFRLLDKKVIQALLMFKERNRFFRGIIDWMGFKKTSIIFDAPQRVDGDSTFTFRKLFSLAINSFTSFSLLPLRITGYLGLAITSITTILLIYMVSAHLIFAITIYTPLAYFVVFNTFLFGIVLSALGLIGLYVGYIHTEVIGRPIFIIQEKVGFVSQCPPSAPSS
jgi:polyisoprenyl-phosphate glycosyltransferase